MIRRRFGRTELQMPVFSCGGMRYQYQWKDLPLSEIPPENQSNLQATIHRALELGINHIETAHGYGSSERQLGVVLPQLDRESLIVQTKVSPQADPAKFRSMFLESLDRLQLDHVDLLGLHGINNFELLWHSIRPNGCLTEARKLVAEGKVKHVGFSTHGPLDVILTAIDHQADGGFDYINLHWYFIFQNNGPAVTAAARRDMGVFIISPADKGGMLYRPPPQLVQLCRPLHPLVFNCLFCLQRPEVHTLSLGAACPQDFELQCSALDYLPAGAIQEDQLVSRISDRLESRMKEVVGHDVVQRYTEGLPSWEATPGYINLPVILWLRHLVRAFDMQEYAKMRYNLLGHAGHWFPGMNAAAVDRLDLSAAIEGSPFKDEIVGWLREAHRQFQEAPQQRLSAS